MPMDMRTDILSAEDWAKVDAFHGVFYGHNAFWMGVPVVKNPLDLMIYQEILWGIQPDTLIECGTAWGGSALFFASIMDLIGHGQVITIDNRTDLGAMLHWAYKGFNGPVPKARPDHPRITYLNGNSTSLHILGQVKRRTHGTTMVVLDSDHHAEYVLAECERYAPLVTPRSYLVVEDIDINGHPLSWPGEDYPGPYEAAIAFLTKHSEFRWNLDFADRYLLSANAWLIHLDEEIERDMQHGTQPADDNSARSPNGTSRGAQAAGRPHVKYQRSTQETPRRTRTRQPTG